MGRKRKARTCASSTGWKLEFGPPEWQPSELTTTPSHIHTMLRTGFNVVAACQDNAQCFIAKERLTYLVLAEPGFLVKYPRKMGGGIIVFVWSQFDGGKIDNRTNRLMVPSKTKKKPS